MTIPRTTLIALIAAGFAAAQHNQLTPREKKERWVLLFDGRTFANWEDPAGKSPPGDSFVIEDGCLKAVKHPRFNEDLFASATFENFELQFDWRISAGGNSGVKYLIQDRVWVKETRGMKFEDQVAQSYKNRDDRRPGRGQQYVVGFEYQCIDNETNPDGRRGGSHSAGALYDMVAPTAAAAKPVGEFNHARIVVRGSRVEHWLNGRKVVDTDLSAPAIADSVAGRWGRESEVYRHLVGRAVKQCRISLQNHNDEAGFRNLKLRRLE